MSQSKQRQQLGWLGAALIAWALSILRQNTFITVFQMQALSLSVKCDTDMIKNETAAGSVRH